MGSMNWQRIIAGGLVAGIILVIADGLIGSLVVAPYVAAHAGSMNAAIFAAGNSAGVSVSSIAKDVVNGLAIVWSYAAIRPRFGPGPRTGVYASVLAWFFVLPFIAVVYTFGVISAGLACITGAAYLVQFLVAGYAGGMLYREGRAATA